MGHIFVNRISDIPAKEHWAIITSSTITIPGDERSRTSPGHGYPEHSENCLRYEAFTDRFEFARELETRIANARTGFGGLGNIRGIHVAGAFSPRTVITLSETDTEQSV